MINKRILVVASYPIVNPQHGGQKRVRATVDYYKSMFVNVQFVGVYVKEFYDGHGKDDIFVGQQEVIDAVYKAPYANDLLAGESIDRDIHVRSYMAKVLQEFQPDIIHVEQVYSYIGLEVLVKELGMSPKWVYGSHNIEFTMKEGIYHSLGLPEATTREFVKKIRVAEETFSKEADLVVAVSKQDATEHQLMGAKRIVVAPNGINKSVASAAAVRHWDDFKKRNGIERALTFIGSAHPPNWTGFTAMMGEDLAYLPAKSKVILAGGIADHFVEAYQNDKEKEKIFWSKALAAGRLSEASLAGLIATSDVLLLPIVTGGGSNLKTAEAVLSGKKVVATDYAFRGFDAQRGLPNIYIAKSAREFKDLVVTAAKAPLEPRTPEQNEIAQKVEWSYCLAPLNKEMKRLARRIVIGRIRALLLVVPRKVKTALRLAVGRGR